jgi:NAD(P)-dependent dehydrogenase (short-subunit alcohol dehydrogenase family)
VRQDIPLIKINFYNIIDKITNEISVVKVMEMKNNKKWNADNISDQNGRVAIITGSSSGIGFETARVLANKNAEVIIAVRNQSKGEKAVQKIKNQNKNADVKLMLLNLASLESVKQFAGEFRKNYDRLDLLINNAGVMIPPYTKTEDGFELQFETNHLGHFALTGLLIDIIKKTPGSRIVNVSSSGHKIGNLNFDDLNWEKRKYEPWKAYGDSKIANLYFTYELKDRLSGKNSNTKVTAAHPGWTATELQRYAGYMRILNRLFAMPVEQGALPTLRAATDENAGSGDYFGPGGFMEMKGYPVKVESNKLSHDKTIADKLWDVSEELTNVKFNLN